MNVKNIKAYELFLVVVTGFLVLGSQAVALNHPPAQKKSQYMKMLPVEIPDFPAEGLILDIGGGR